MAVHLMFKVAGSGSKLRLSVWCLSVIVTETKDRQIAVLQDGAWWLRVESTRLLPRKSESAWQCSLSVQWRML
jgi:hypothetical protein